MSDTGITSGTPAARATSRRHAVNIFALWVLQALLAIMFAMAGFARWVAMRRWWRCSPP